MEHVCSVFLFFLFSVIIAYKILEAKGIWVDHGIIYIVVGKEKLCFGKKEKTRKNMRLLLHYEM